MAVGSVHLFYGLAGSGKTTLARELSSGGCGVRFTLDELSCVCIPTSILSPSIMARRQLRYVR